MILAPIEPFHVGRRCVTRKLLAVKLSYKVHRTATAIHKAWVNVDNHHPLLVLFVAVNGHLEEVRTFKLIGLRSVALAPLAQVLPIL